MPILTRPVILATLFLFLVRALPTYSPSQVCDQSTTSFDFIIVGGGTAGPALATRLSQRLDSCILLLEAGPAALDDPIINIPGRKGSALGTKYDWNFTTTAQTSAYNRSVPLNRGKVLGGSSAINLLSWDRASVAEYDSWENLGNPGWNWQSMLPAMLKVENFTGANTEYYGSAGVGSTGPIQSTINRYQPTHQTYYVPTLEKLGNARNLEALGGNPIGAFYQPSNIDSRSWRRSYSANAYLPFASSNLVVKTDSTMATVNFHRVADGLTATGVTLDDGTIFEARDEVVLSAGSVQSPGLLERSGIGQPSVLENLGIEVLEPLGSVGENLQDHIRIMTSWQLKDNYTSVDLLRTNATYAAEQLSLYDQGQISAYDYTGSAYTFTNWLTGILPDSAALTEKGLTEVGDTTSPVDREKLSFLSSPTGDHVPQVELIFSDGYTGLKGYPAQGSPLYGKGFMTLIIALQHPFSKGSIHINSLYASATPLINPNYISYQYEVDALVEAVKYARNISGTYPMSQAWDAEYEPGVEVATDEQIADYIRRTVTSIWHPVGTCSMLPRDQGGVVDPELKVYETTNLRVVDASVMPLLPSAHIQTAVYGIAERAAEFIVGARS